MALDNESPQAQEPSVTSFNLSHAVAHPAAAIQHSNQPHRAHSPPSEDNVAHVQNIQRLLAKRPGPEYLTTRPGAGGSKFTYIEGWRAIELANEIFGFNGWSTETKSLDVDYVDLTPDGKYNVGVSAIVRISLKDGSTHEDVGYGKIDNCPTKGDALEKCKKEAVTDALKRSLRVFGNLLGNCLYDKNFLGNVKNVQAQKEKFLISKLHRPAYATTSNSSDSKPSTGEAPLKLSTASSVSVAPAQSTSAKPIINKPACPKPSIPPAPSSPLKPESNRKRFDTFPPAPRQIQIREHLPESVKTIDSRPELEHVILEYSSTPSDHLLDFDESDLAQLDANEQSMLQDQDLSEMTLDDNSLNTEPSVLLSSGGGDETCAPKGLPVVAQPAVLPLKAASALRKSTSNIPLNNNSNNILDRSLTKPYQSTKQLPPRAMTTNPHRPMNGGYTKAALVPQAGQLPGLRGGAAGALNKSNVGRNSLTTGTENKAPDDSTRGVKRSLDHTLQTRVSLPGLVKPIQLSR